MGPLVVERTYAASVEKVGEAIMVKEKMKQWYFDLHAFEPKAGFEFEFSGQDEGRTFLHQCKVTEVIPLKKLVYTWRYKNYPGHSSVAFELFPEGNETRLKLTHAGLESFPAEPSFRRSNFEMGWTTLLGKMLKEFIEK